MLYSSIDDTDDIITCISSDDDDTIGPYFTHEIGHDENDNDNEPDDELIEVVDDVEFVEETDALDVNNGDENNSSVFAFEMF